MMTVIVFYTYSPVCVPARVSLATGLYPPSLPLEDYADVHVGRKAAEYLRNYSDEKPWFCWVSFGGPHEPWDTPEPFASMYKPEDMPEPAPLPEVGGDRPRGQLDWMTENRPSFEEGDIAACRADYAGKVSLIDLGPTLVELVGGKIEYEQNAKSLVPSLKDPAIHTREFVISELTGEVMVMDGEWKMAVNQQEETYLLFNRKADPLEQNNLAGVAEYRDVELMLKEKTLARMVSSQHHLPLFQ